jgi:hypothetical protein
MRLVLSYFYVNNEHMEISTRHKDLCWFRHRESTLHPVVDVVLLVESRERMVSSEGYPRPLYIANGLGCLRSVDLESMLDTSWEAIP